MGESRSELLEWLNNLLGINYSKVEQCGTGAAYCQIFDSIYGDVPMSRVKFNAKQEYEYLANFRILQNTFKAHKVDKPIPVERLVKCKMQDNLEFLQWAKREYDKTSTGIAYDPVARRKGAPMEPSTIAPVARSSHAATLAPSRSGGRTPIGGARSTSSNASVSHELVANLQAQLREVTVNTEGLEKERDFYFTKLRDIEILVQQQLEVLEAEGKDDPVLKEIQKILYSTEDGFEVPEAGAEGVPEEEETF